MDWSAPDAPLRRPVRRSSCCGLRERRGRRPITQLIDNGVPVGAYSTVTVRAARSRGGSIGNARRASHKSVPRAAPTCLILEPTTSLTNLMSDLAEAVYIQQLSGSSAGINPVTGRIDVGGIGWLLQAGQPVGRVETIAISRSLTAFCAPSSRLATTRIKCHSHQPLPAQWSATAN